MLHSRRILNKYASLTKLLSSNPKTNQSFEQNISYPIIKPGSLNYIRLESGEEICVIRPLDMTPIPTDLKLLYTFEKSKDLFIQSNNINKDLKKEMKINFLNKYQNPLIEIKSFPLVESISDDVKLVPISQKFKIYLKLGKFRLTTFVVISCVSGFLMAPVPFNSFMLLFASSGTFLTSMAANTINQILEIPYDSQMKRTRYRPLVLGQITPLHATLFSILCASTGSMMLFFCNPLACGLGLSNLVLYSFIYTPFKRISIINTWLGAIVGGIPPLIGWAAATGGIHTGGILIFVLLFCWQFPHFMALSWNLKSDYAKAGYQMTSTAYPELCQSSALHYSIIISLLCSIAPMTELTNWTFPIVSLPFNIALCYLAYQFYSNPGSSSSRKLFKYTLIYLPILMTLLILNKNYSNNQNSSEFLSNKC